MLDSQKLKYKPYIDSRRKTSPGFTVGFSGQLLISESDAGEKYIVKHTYPFNAANEYVGCWLAEKLGIPVPRAFLLTPNRAFKSDYAVAIEFLENLKVFEYKSINDMQKRDVLGQMVLGQLIDNTDRVQMNMYRDRVVSYDFSDAFNTDGLKYALDLIKVSEDRAIDQIGRVFAQYRERISIYDYDLPETSAAMGMAAEDTHKIMVEMAKGVQDISENEINNMGDELAEMYPLTIAVYYEECIHAMQERVKEL